MSDPSQCLIIAEIGSVHDGSFGNAMKLIEAAAQCKVDAVKFQTHIAGAETLRNAPQPPYFRGEPRYEYFERTAFSFEKWLALKAHCEEQAVEFISSPFSIEAVHLLQKLGMKRWKVGSGEITNIPMLEAIARTGKPVLLSSGMSSWSELDAAVECILHHHRQLILLQCTSEYPCPSEKVGLNVMLEMRARYQLPVGFSDHSLANYAAFAAATLGASVVEKHFTFSRLMYGSDARHSLEPPEFADLVRGVRAIETCLANPVDKNANALQLQFMKEIFEKSVVSVADINQGQILQEKDLTVKKPGTGIPARRLKEMIGKTARQFIPKDSLIKEEDIDA